MLQLYLKEIGTKDLSNICIAEFSKLFNIQEISENILCKRFYFLFKKHASTKKGLKKNCVKFKTTYSKGIIETLRLNHLNCLIQT